MGPQPEASQVGRISKLAHRWGRRRGRGPRQVGVQIVPILPTCRQFRAPRGKQANKQGISLQMETIALGPLINSRLFIVFFCKKLWYYPSLYSAQVMMSMASEGGHVKKKKILRKIPKN